MPSRQQMNLAVWIRQFRTLLVGGLGLALIGLVFQLTGLLHGEGSAFVVFGLTVAVIGGVGLGILVLVDRRR